MKYHKLRIAWSVVCGVVALLLCVLWVRSYWRWDEIGVPLGANGYSLTSAVGRLGLYGERPDVPVTSWWYFHTEVDAPFLDNPHRSGVPRSLSLSNLELRSIAAAPHLSLIFLLVVVSTLPWLRPRFSLRTLLIATTLIAVVLGIIAWARR
jgi:hypothetical protein